MYRPIDRYWHSKHKKSTASLNTTSHLLCVYLCVQTEHCWRKIGKNWDLGLELGLVVAVRGGRVTPGVRGGGGGGVCCHVVTVTSLLLLVT